MAQAINAGYSTDIINLPITNAGWTGLTLSKKPNNLCIRLRETGDIYVSLDNAGTTFFTVKDGTALTYDWNAGKTTDIIFLKGSVNGTAEIIVTYE